MSTQERFAPLLGPDFKVAFELRSEDILGKYPVIFETAVRKGLGIVKGRVGTIFVPPYATSSDNSLEEVLSGKTARVLFEGDSRHIATECFLVFRRKFDFKSHEARLWMLVAREGEEGCFNAFSSLHASPSHQEYVSLLYASSVKKDFAGFKPLFLKINIRDAYHYFKVVVSEGETGDVLVELSSIPASSAPPALQIASRM